MFKGSKNSEMVDKTIPVAIDPIPPHLRERPFPSVGGTSVDYMPRRQRSAKYAEAMEEADKLEQDLQAERSASALLRSQLQVVEESNTILHEEIAGLKKDNERLVRENTTIHERLKIVAEILINLMKPVDMSALAVPGLDKDKLAEDVVGQEHLESEVISGRAAFAPSK